MAAPAMMLFLITFIENVFIRVTLHDTETALEWTGTQIDFLYFLNERMFQKFILISFECLQKTCILTKFGERSSKIEPTIPISIFNFSRAWQSLFFELELSPFASK